MLQSCKCTIIQTSPFFLQFYKNIFLQDKTGHFPDQNYFFQSKVKKQGNMDAGHNRNKQKKTTVSSK